LARVFNKAQMSDCQPVRLMIEQPLAKAPDARKTDSLLYILERL
jgi:hypothetical protein